MKIQRFVRGEQIANTRPKLNALVDAVNRDLSARGSVGPQSLFPGSFLWLEIRVLVPGGPPWQLECSLPGQQLNPSAEKWLVDPPPTFTPATRNGVTYVYTDINNRTADGTEVQQLTPLYLVQDLIAVVNLEEGTNWRDLNIDGRQWAAVP